MLTRCLWAFSLTGNGWTKAPDGQWWWWWGMTGRFNVNNRHPFHHPHHHQHRLTLFDRSFFSTMMMEICHQSAWWLLLHSQPLYQSDSSENGAKRATNTMEPETDTHINTTGGWLVRFEHNLKYFITLPPLTATLTLMSN